MVIGDIINTQMINTSVRNLHMVCFENNETQINFIFILLIFYDYSRKI